MTGLDHGPWALVAALLDDSDGDPLRTPALDRLARSVLGQAPTGELARELARCGSARELAAVLLQHRTVQVAGPDERERIQSELVRSLAFSGDPLRAEQLARQLLAARPTEETAPATWAALVHTLLVQGRWDELAGTVDQALSEIGNDSRWVARLLAERALAATWLGDAQQARADAQLAMDEGRARGDHVAQSRGAAHLSVIIGQDGDVERAVELATQGLEVARQDPEAMQLHPHMALAMAQLSADRLDDALGTLAEGRRVGEERRTTWDLPLYDAMIALVLEALGRWDDAVAEAETGLRLAEDLGTGVGRVTSLAVLAGVAVRRNRFAQAREAIDRADEEVRRHGPQWGLAQVDHVRAWLDAAEGRTPQAVQQMTAAWRASSVQGRWAGACGLAVIAHRAARADLLDELADWTQRPDLMGSYPMARLSRAACLGLRDGDADLVRDAARRASVVGRRPLAAVLTEVAGDVARSGGDPAAAVRDWTMARELAWSLGADHDVARLAASLRGLGQTPGPRSAHRAATSGWEALTPSERQVAELTATGLTNHDIGERLFISPRTVQSHLSHTYRKLDITSRVQLASLVTERESRA